MLRARVVRYVAVAAVLCAGVCARAQKNVPGQTKPQHVPRGEKHAFERQVIDLEEQWRKAQLSGDVDSMDRLLADDYIGITSTGLVNDKQQQLQRMRARTAPPIRIDVSERKVKVIGSTAIVTSRVQVEGMNEGVSTDGMYRYTRVYSRQRDGSWKVVNFESTRIPAMQQAGGGRVMQAPPPPGPPPVR